MTSYHVFNKPHGGEIIRAVPGILEAYKVFVDISTIYSCEKLKANIALEAYISVCAPSKHTGLLSIDTQHATSNPWSIPYIESVGL